MNDFAEKHARVVTVLRRIGDSCFLLLGKVVKIQNLCHTRSSTTGIKTPLSPNHPLFLSTYYIFTPTSSSSLVHLHSPRLHYTPICIRPREILWITLRPLQSITSNEVEITILQRLTAGRTAKPHSKGAKSLLTPAGRITDIETLAKAQFRFDLWQKESSKIAAVDL